jgi:hypothetical protein
VSGILLISAGTVLDSWTIKPVLFGVTTGMGTILAGHTRFSQASQGLFIYAPWHIYMLLPGSGMCFVQHLLQ